MFKKLLCLFLVFFIFVPSTCLGATKDDNGKLSIYALVEDKLYISLPSGWYTNTQEFIDQDFLTVSDNSERKLKKYLNQQNIAYNLLSKDLSEEINVVLQHNSNTKLLFDFNSMKDEELINEAEAATQNNGEDKESDADKDKIVYYDYEIKKINDCKYIILKGELKSPSRNAKIIQYTTIINGYGITVSYRAYDNANIEDGYILMDEVIDSVDVKVVETNNPKMTIVEQLLPIVLLIISFICITLFIRKRKKSS